MADCCGPIIRSAQVKCPLYITDDKFARTLTCEGYDEVSVLLTRFRDYKPKYNHMKKRCAGTYKECPIYKLVLNERYGGED
jgi:hypothetical protein